MRRNIRIILIIILLLMLGLSVYTYFKIINRKGYNFDVSSYYNKYVTTYKKSNIYVLESGKYIKKGYIDKNINLVLDEIKDKKSSKFKISNYGNEFYIDYKDIRKIDEVKIDNRFLSYIPYNINAKTENKTDFYDENGKIVLSIDKGYNLPVIVKDKDYYGVNFNDKLLYLSTKDVVIEDSNNTDKSNTKGIAVLNYHFFWDDDTEKASCCTQIICHSKSQFKSHLEMFKENNFFTPTMRELEMYIDGKIQLPKSVVITIDDGYRSKLGIDILGEYKLNGTLFLISGNLEPSDYETEYVELHSHTHNLHNPGKCPGGQGGGIKCLPRDVILEDLRSSRKKLKDSTVLCYPFYEYNNYSIGLVKEAGFTMAFAGGGYKVKVGSNKYELPRYVIHNTTSANTVLSYIS